MALVADSHNGGIVTSSRDGLQRCQVGIVDGRDNRWVELISTSEFRRNVMEWSGPRATYITASPSWAQAPPTFHLGFEFLYGLVGGLGVGPPLPPPFPPFLRGILEFLEFFVIDSVGFGL